MSDKKNAEYTISNPELSQTIEHFSNIDQTIVHITEDKIRLILLNLIDSLREKDSWSTPFGFFITALITLLTTTSFKPFFYLSADTWQAIFVIMMFISGYFILRACWLCHKNKITIDEAIQIFKNASKSNDNLTS